MESKARGAYYKSYYARHLTIDRELNTVKTYSLNTATRYTVYVVVNSLRQNLGAVDFDHQKWQSSSYRTHKKTVRFSDVNGILGLSGWVADHPTTG